jgi:opacity protein-like surface antigen
VIKLKAILAASAAACFLVLTATRAGAEEIEHKFRIAFSAGGFSITDQQHSAAANVRVLLRTDGQIDTVIQDPRNDSGAFSDFGLEPQYGANLSASYGITRLWYVEASLGYRQGHVGNVMVQAMFNNVPTTAEQPNNYAVYNIDGGTISQVPLQFTTGIRFRPKASFNPYLCLGVGYSFNSFKPSAQLNDLSLAMDQSVGAFALLSQGSPGVLEVPTEGYGSLRGITVDAPGAPEWHFGGGFEYTVASHWSIFLDARYTVYSGKFHMTVNGADELGVSVPNDQIVETDPGAFGPFGGVYVRSGGLIDGGSLVPKPGFPTANCATSPGNCEFTGPPDGIKDTGWYYVQAGRVRYDNASYQIGFKFTF